jgi:hypothetical protein
MPTLNYLIVEQEEAYNNEVELSSGKSLIVNSTIESVDHISRTAKVIEAPDSIILKRGDQVVVHHNIFRQKNDVKGKTIKSDYHIGDNKYYIPLTEVFLYKRNSDWVAIDPYVFIKPIPLRDEGNLLLGTKKEYKGREHQKGKISFINGRLQEQGLKEGDEISFARYSEYEFDIEGELYYKMRTQDIIAKL